MQEKNLFEYAVIRIVPQVEREEFLNVGIILYCPKLKYLKCIYTIDEQRLCSFSSRVDISELESHLHSFNQICLGSNSGSPIAQLDLASRFRWLTATRSTVVQSSKVHPGLCTDPEVTLLKLYNQMVL